MTGLYLFVFTNLTELMDDETRAKLWFKPRGLWRHDLTAVGYVHNLLHRYWIEGQSGTHLTRVNTALQLTKSTKASHKVDTL